MLKLNNIYNMDCIEGLKQLDTGTIDLIVTSPPYNLGIKYDTWDDHMEYEEYLKWCTEWLTECYRVLKDDGRICVDHYFCCKRWDCDDRWYPLMDIRMLMEKIGYKMAGCAYWIDSQLSKQSAWGSYMSASAPYVSSPYEGILIACKKQWKKQNKGKSTMDKDTFVQGCSGIWNIGTTPGYTIACFPEELPRICIELFTYEDDVVMDPFSGSGTTCYVAKGLQRKFIGFELSPAYYEQSLSRLAGSPYKVQPKQKEGPQLQSLW